MEERQDNPEFFKFTANLFFSFNIDWSKYFLFALFFARWQLMLIKQLIDEIWELENSDSVTDLLDQVMGGWKRLVSNAVDCYSQFHIAQKSANCKPNLKLVLSMWPSNITFHLWLFWLQILVVIDSESWAAIWSGCAQYAVGLESEQMPTSRTVTRHRFRSAASHRTWFNTCWFVPMP